MTEDITKLAPTAAYTEELTEYFGGRIQEIQSLTRLIASNRFVLLHGPAGAGKTSLLGGGVFSSLRSKKNASAIFHFRVPIGYNWTHPTNQPEPACEQWNPPEVHGQEREKWTHEETLRALNRFCKAFLDLGFLQENEKSIYGLESSTTCDFSKSGARVFVALDSFENALIAAAESPRSKDTSVDSTASSEERMVCHISAIIQCLETDLNEIERLRECSSPNSFSCSGIWVMRNRFVGRFMRLRSYIPGHGNCSLPLSRLPISSAIESIFRLVPELQEEQFKNKLPLLQQALGNHQIQGTEDGEERLDGVVQPVLVRLFARELRRNLDKIRSGELAVNGLLNNLDPNSLLESYVDEAADKAAMQDLRLERALRLWLEGYLINNNNDPKVPSLEEVAEVWKGKPDAFSQALDVFDQMGVIEIQRTGSDNSMVGICRLRHRTLIPAIQKSNLQKASNEDASTELKYLKQTVRYAQNGELDIIEDAELEPFPDSPELAPIECNFRQAWVERQEAESKHKKLQTEIKALTLEQSKALIERQEAESKYKKLQTEIETLTSGQIKLKKARLFAFGILIVLLLALGVTHSFLEKAKADKIKTEGIILNLDIAKKEAEKKVAEAKKEADKKVAEAKEEADKKVAKAKEVADKKVAEVKEVADKKADKAKTEAKDQVAIAQANADAEKKNVANAAKVFLPTLGAGLTTYGSVFNFSQLVEKLGSPSNAVDLKTKLNAPFANVNTKVKWRTSSTLMPPILAIGKSKTAYWQPEGAVVKVGAGDITHVVLKRPNAKGSLSPLSLFWESDDQSLFAIGFCDGKLEVWKWGFDPSLAIDAVVPESLAIAGDTEQFIKERLGKAEAFPTAKKVLFSTDESLWLCDLSSAQPQLTCLLGRQQYYTSSQGLGIDKNLEKTVGKAIVGEGVSDSVWYQLESGNFVFASLCYVDTNRPQRSTDKNSPIQTQRFYYWFHGATTTGGNPKLADVAKSDRETIHDWCLGNEMPKKFKDPSGLFGGFAEDLNLSLIFKESIVMNTSMKDEAIKNQAAKSVDGELGVLMASESKTTLASYSFKLSEEPKNITVQKIASESRDVVSRPPVLLQSILHSGKKISFAAFARGDGTCVEWSNKGSAFGAYKTLSFGKATFWLQDGLIHVVDPSGIHCITPSLPSMEGLTALKLSGVYRVGDCSNRRVALSKNGKWLVAACFNDAKTQDTRPVVWDTKTQQIKWVLDKSGYPVTAEEVDEEEDELHVLWADNAGQIFRQNGETDSKKTRLYPPEEEPGEKKESSLANSTRSLSTQWRVVRWINSSTGVFAAGSEDGMFCWNGTEFLSSEHTLNDAVVEIVPVIDSEFKNKLPNVVALVATLSGKVYAVKKDSDPEIKSLIYQPILDRNDSIESMTLMKHPNDEAPLVVLGHISGLVRFYEWNADGENLTLRDAAPSSYQPFSFQSTRVLRLEPSDNGQYLFAGSYRGDSRLWSKLLNDSGVQPEYDPFLPPLQAHVRAIRFLSDQNILIVLARIGEDKINSLYLQKLPLKMTKNQ
ncbi:MAG: hypothetical protein IPK32_00350 [Verrucomicrobiaceae bacterium]|nr:hypothetical protein [Verrucomicrobiaceae bacterium]